MKSYENVYEIGEENEEQNDSERKIESEEENLIRIDEKQIFPIFLYNV